MPRRSVAAPIIPCECGCGALIRAADRHGRPRRFVEGHSAGKVDRRPGHRRRRMSKKAAEAICGKLGAPGKMPGFSYGLDPFACRMGSKLAEVPGSVCEGCYARDHNYTRWPGVSEAWAVRMKAIRRREWPSAMAELVRWAGDREPFFRWHDSGDLMSADHLLGIVEVALMTRNVMHWLPTRELVTVAGFVGDGGIIPPNLTVRLSAFDRDRAPEVPELLAHLPTSTVNSVKGRPVQVGASRKSSIECRAYTRGGVCGSCRACWDPRVKNVSYPVHGSGRRSEALQVVA